LSCCHYASRHWPALQVNTQYSTQHPNVLLSGEYQ
jgi:hypothetical protein